MPPSLVACCDVIVHWASARSSVAWWWFARRALNVTHSKKNVQLRASRSAPIEVMLFSRGSLRHKGMYEISVRTLGCSLLSSVCVGLCFPGILGVDQLSRAYIIDIPVD